MVGSECALFERGEREMMIISTVRSPIGEEGAMKHKGAHGDETSCVCNAMPRSERSA